MAFNLRNRSLLTVQDMTQREFRYLLDLARDLKRAKYARTEQKHLQGKEICLIFEKTSTRTRCAFEVACHDQGANVTYLDPAGSQIGHKESFKDTARVLGRMYDGIEYRGASRKGVETLAKYAGVPVYSVLPYSNWEWGRVVQSESLLAIRLGLQSAVGMLRPASEAISTVYASRRRANTRRQAR